MSPAFRSESGVELLSRQTRLMLMMLAATAQETRLMLIMLVSGGGRLLTLFELRGLLSKKTSCGCRPGLSRNSHTRSYSRTVPCKMRHRLEPIPPRSLPFMKIALLWRGLLVGVADI